MKIMSGTCRATGKMVYLVESRAEANAWHIVWRETDGFHCDCRSFNYGRKGHCVHTNAVKMEILDAMAYIGAKWLPPMKVKKPVPVVSAGMAAQARRRATLAEMDRALPVDQGEFSIYKAS